MSNPVYRKNISREEIELVEKEYKIKIHNIEQLFLGADPDTFAYRTDCEDNKKYFLKIRTGNFIESSIIIPYLLSQEINRHIIEPVKTINDNLFLRTSEYTIILYPFITGQSGIQCDLTEDQWIEFGKLLHRIHNNKSLLDTSEVPKETFDTRWNGCLKKYMKELDAKPAGNDLEKRFIDMMVSRKGIIHEILEKTDELVPLIKKSELNYCLCHGDIHAGNIFISKDDFFIVDWDTLIMAPKERDLMFIGGAVANKWNIKKEEDFFYHGYGDHNKVNKSIIKYYRYIRIIEDLVVYYEEFYTQGMDEENRKSIIETVDSAFWPGGVVEIALS